MAAIAAYKKGYFLFIGLNIVLPVPEDTGTGIFMIGDGGDFTL